jgi:catalase
MGALITDGVDAGALQALKDVVEKEGAILKLVAPAVGGVTASDGSWIEADEKLGGGPSVLFDAVALLVSKEGAQMLADEPAARDFVADAFAHMKFIGYAAAAAPLLDKAGIARDAGVIELASKNAATFVRSCRALRLWEREAAIKRT